jgi:hypothetical protein
MKERSALVVGIVVVLALAGGGVARAQYTEGPYHCASDSSHPDEIPPGCEQGGTCSNGCWCYDACGTAGTQAYTPQQTGWLLFEILSPVAFFLAPGHTTEAFFHHDGTGAFQTSAAAKAEWDAFVAKRKDLEDLGRRRIAAQRDSVVAAAKARDTFAAEERDARAKADQVKDVAKELRFVVPKLVPTAIGSFQCDQARVLMPSVHTDAPIAGFPSEHDMIASCQASIAPPVRPDDGCGATSLACGTDPPKCCPAGYTILNDCDLQCYKDNDFRGGETEEGRHCQTSRTCAAFQPR